MYSSDLGPAHPLVLWLVAMIHRRRLLDTAYAIGNAVPTIRSVVAGRAIPTA